MSLLDVSNMKSVVFAILWWYTFSWGNLKEINYKLELCKGIWNPMVLGWMKLERNILNIYKTVWNSDNGGVKIKDVMFQKTLISGSTFGY